MCAAWIPEIYISDIKEYPTKLTIKGIDKKRFRLKCGLCSGKGACVECKHGKCRTAAHPWCVVNKPGGYTRRVVKDEDDDLIWQIFCKTHASSVTDPLKPKQKSKVVQQLAGVAIPGSEPIEKIKEKVKKNDRESLPQLSMAHSVKKINLTAIVKKPVVDTVHNIDQPSEEYKNSSSSSSSGSAVKSNGKNSITGEKSMTPKNNGKNEKSDVSSRGKKARGPYKKKGSISGTENGDSDGDEIDGKHDNNTSGSGSGGGGKDNLVDKKGVKSIKSKQNNHQMNKNGNNTIDDNNQDNNQDDNKNNNEDNNNDDNKIGTDPTDTLESTVNYSILTLNEWPGQSEGEAMDLDHFWNVAAMQYPEDHPAAVSGLFFIYLFFHTVFHFFVHKHFFFLFFCILSLFLLYYVVDFFIF